MSGYELQASPTLYPGQTVRAEVEGAPARLLIRVYDERDELVTVRGPGLEWRVPDTGGQPIAEVGIETDGPARLRSLTWDGAPEVTLGRPAGGTLWRRAWVHGVDRWGDWWPEAVPADPGPRHRPADPGHARVDRLRGPRRDRARDGRRRRPRRPRAGPAPLLRAAAAARPRPARARARRHDGAGRGAVRAPRLRRAARARAARGRRRSACDDRRDRARGARRRAQPAAPSRSSASAAASRARRSECGRPAKAERRPAECGPSAGVLAGQVDERSSRRSQPHGALDASQSRRSANASVRRVPAPTARSRQDPRCYRTGSWSRAARRTARVPRGRRRPQALRTARRRVPRAHRASACRP